MLQQTKVETVLPYFERFMAAFPTVEALASAPLDAVLGQWSGLGYYSRARNLHKAAGQVVAAGGFPSSVAGWRALPGVGPYMAGAVVSIALGQDVATVDGNIARVLSRVHREASTGAVIWKLAESHLAVGRAGDHNQALMDLGALVCTPRSPRCDRCPIAAHCQALQVGDIECFPVPKARKKSPVWRLVCAVVRREDRVLLAKRPPAGLFGGLWEPPMFRAGDAGLEQVLLAGLREMGLAPDSTSQRPGFRHVLTHRTLDLTPFDVVASGQPSVGEYQEVAWFRGPEFSGLGLSTLARRALGAAG
jgi:A/G-specific adenine glycosylase